LQVDAENALERTNKKFMKRFNGMEAAASEQNKQLHDMTLTELDILWNKMKETHL
jgi:XTP/dITP diphosphohydrolase